MWQAFLEESATSAQVELTACMTAWMVARSAAKCLRESGEYSTHPRPTCEGPEPNTAAIALLLCRGKRPTDSRRSYGLCLLLAALYLLRSNSDVVYYPWFALFLCSSDSVTMMVSCLFQLVAKRFIILRNSGSNWMLNRICQSFWIAGWWTGTCVRHLALRRLC